MIKGERSKRSRAKIQSDSKTGLKLLNSLAFAEIRVKHPSIRPELLPYPKFSDKTANELTRSIIHFLQLKGHQAERITVTGRPIDKRQTFTDVLGRSRTIGRMTWIPGTGTKGSADISAIIQGKSVKIEVKTGRDRQSEYQKEYQKKIESAGGIYVIVSSFEQFYNWYCKEFKK